MKDIVTAEDVQSVPPGGEVTAAPGAIVTPWAREMAASRGVRIVHGPARTDGQVVALGADHGGFALKEEVKTHLTRLGYRFHDVFHLAHMTVLGWSPRISFADGIASTIGWYQARA